MVNISEKSPTRRIARAEAVITILATTARALRSDSLQKGDALATAKIAAILGAKQTPSLVPLCHPVALTGVDVAIKVGPTRVTLTVTAETIGQTGVEMEAMVGASTGALALYDMVKSIDRTAHFSVRLLTKSGGRSGSWKRGS